MLALRRVPWDQVEPNDTTYESFDRLCPPFLSQRLFLGQFPQPPSPQLGLWWPCSKAIARAAYRRKAKHLHPDHGGDPATFHALLAEYERFNAPLLLWWMPKKRRLLVDALLTGQDPATAARAAGTSVAWAWRYVAQYLDVWAVLTWEGIDHLALLETCPADTQKRLEWCIGRLEE